MWTSTFAGSPGSGVTTPSTRQDPAPAMLLGSSSMRSEGPLCCAWSKAVALGQRMMHVPMPIVLHIKQPALQASCSSAEVDMLICPS